MFSNLAKLFLRHKHQHGIRKCCTERMNHSVFIECIAFTDANARRAVSHNDARNALRESCNAGLSGCTCDGKARISNLTRHCVIHIECTDIKRNDLLLRELLDNRLNLIILLILRLYGSNLSGKGDSLHVGKVLICRRLLRNKILKIRFSKHILKLCHNLLLRNLNNAARGCVHAAVSETKHIISRFKYKGCLLRVIGRNLRKCERKLHALAFSLREHTAFRKCGQTLIRLTQLSARNGDIQLKYLLACVLARIFHGCSYFYRLSLKRYLRVLDGELRVGKAISEWVLSLLTNRVKVAIPHIHALGIARVIISSEFTDGRVLIPGRPGGRKFSRRVALSKHNIRQNITGLHAELGQYKNVLYLLHLRQIDHATGIDDQHEILIQFVAAKDVPLLCLRKKYVTSRGTTVTSLSGKSRQHIDGRLSLLNRKLVLRLEHDTSHSDREGFLVLRLRFFLNLLDKCGLCLLNDLLITIKPCAGRDGKSRIFKAFLYRHEESGIHLARTRTAFDGVSDSISVKRDISGFFQWKMPVLLQNHGTLRPIFPQVLIVFFFIAI